MTNYRWRTNSWRPTPQRPRGGEPLLHEFQRRDWVLSARGSLTLIDRGARSGRLGSCSRSLGTAWNERRCRLALTSVAHCSHLMISAAVELDIMNVKDVLALKGSVVIAVKPSQTILELSRLLREKRIGAAVVSANGQTIDGVISERDVAYGLANHKAELHSLLVSDLMTTTVITCAPNDRIAFVASTMLSRNIRHLPVVEGSRVIGMVSIRDVLNSRLDELQQTTAQLRAFVVEASREPQDRE